MKSESGSVIEKPYSQLSIVAEHFGGFVGLVFSLVWIIFVLVISYVEPFKQDFFLDAWYHSLIFIALVPTILDLFGHSFRLMLGKVQQMLAIDSMTNGIGAICIFVIYLTYPFDFGGYNDMAKFLFLLLSILKVLTALDNGFKYLTWEERLKKSLTQ